MHRLSLYLLGLLAVAVTAIHPLPDVSGHLDRALQEIQENLDVVQKYVRKRKKVTKSSRYLALRHRVAARAVASLKKDGVDSEHASFLVHRALQKHGFRPAGFFKNMETAGEELICERNPQCHPMDLFRTITGECNNLNQPLYGAVDVAFLRLLPPAYDDGKSVPRGGLVTLEDIEQEEEEEEEEEEGNGKGDGKGKAANKKKKKAIKKAIKKALKKKKAAKTRKGNGKLFLDEDELEVERSQGRVELPLPRFISTSFFPDQNLPSNNLSHMFMQVGQFTDHDLTFAPEEEVEECCEHPDEEGCFPVVLPLNDTFFSTFDQNCFQFTRSTPFCPDGTGIRQQFNSITGFLDSSNVYGSTNAMSQQLRANMNGLLAVNPNFPAVPGILPGLGPNGALLAGDSRVEEQPGLSAIHNIFFREHNRLARLIQRARPAFTDEQVFEHARRILNAQWQNIIYSEFLPIVFGSANVESLGLALPPHLGGFTTYDASVDATIVHAFGTAAFRFGHSFIQGSFNLNNPASPASASRAPFALCLNFDNSDIFLENNGAGAEQIITGLLNQPAQTGLDRFITDNLTNHLLPEAENLGSFGQDLMARNIQRGRDHGLPGYTAYRSFCNLSAISSFSRRSKPADISLKNFRLLKSIYAHPDDIDLWVGGVAETHITGTLLGPTFTCIQALQWRRLMVGDRFFFTHSGQAGSFTSSQLTVLRGRSLRDIICQNSPHLASVKANAMLTTGAPISCSTVAPLNVVDFL